MSADPVNDALRRRCKELPIDGTSFTRPLARCDFERCRGICCYDGVYVDSATEAAIVALVDARRSDFTAMGLDLPREVVVDGVPGGGVSGRKTACRNWDADAVVRDVPADFDRSACVFHFDDGRCGLHVLAVQDGRHPWAYKPPSCWLFPISIHHGTIALHDDGPHASPDDGYNRFVMGTRCGGPSAGGQPALTVLADELRYLGDILGRDLIAEAEALITS